MLHYFIQDKSKDLIEMHQVSISIDEVILIQANTHHY